MDGYNYSKCGCYFVTIDVQDKLKLFWKYKKINAAGKMVEQIIDDIPVFYKGIFVIEYVVMPDHVHLIIEINDVGADPRIRPISINPIEQVGADPCIRPITINPIEQVGADPRIRPISINPIEQVGADPCIRPKIGQTQGSARTFGKKLSLSDVIQRFKMLTTKKYISGVKNNNWPKFHHRLWQRNYYERVIRNEFELNRIRKYIQDNPKKIQ
jgi:REP element-mobilizing transposase RayT